MAADRLSTLDVIAHDRREHPPGALVERRLQFGMETAAGHGVWNGSRTSYAAQRSRSCAFARCAGRDTVRADGHARTSGSARPRRTGGAAANGDAAGADGAAAPRQPAV